MKVGQIGPGDWLDVGVQEREKKRLRHTGGLYVGRLGGWERGGRFGREGWGQIRT